jgi:hypothetical protein
MDDTTKALTELRKSIDHYRMLREHGYGMGEFNVTQVAEECIDMMQDLDSILTAGGILPHDWRMEISCD